MDRGLKICCFLGMMLTFSCKTQQKFIQQTDFDTAKIIEQANQYLKQDPIPITNFRADRSAGGIHDFYSEGDYWWPNPEDPDGPYIRRDGQTNPENFTAHREAMRDLSRWVAALTAAYKITKDEKYAEQALKHLQAWFVNPATMMNPSLLYAQAIKGVVSGRGIGIIDTIHLIEVAKSIQELRRLGFLTDADFADLQGCFDQYATWLTTHPYGIDERDHGNNHSTWWAVQVAAFADLANRSDLMEAARQQFKKLLGSQMSATGGFPEELSRTKPYNYTLFNLESYAVLAHIASTQKDNLWSYQTKNGSLRTAWDFMFPYIDDKSTWTRPPDVQHFDELPIQSSGLLFAGLAYKNDNFIQLWKKLSPERQSKEIDRTYPLRQPILWIDDFQLLMK